jgi:hypothetical protein
VIPPKPDSEQPPAVLDAEFEKQLDAEVEAARARIRSAPNPLACLTPEDIRRSRASALPEIIGVAPTRKTGASGES